MPTILSICSPYWIGFPVGAVLLLLREPISIYTPHPINKGELAVFPHAFYFCRERALVFAVSRRLCFEKAMHREYASKHGRKRNCEATCFVFCSQIQSRFSNGLLKFKGRSVPQTLDKKPNEKARHLLFFLSVSFRYSPTIVSTWVAHLETDISVRRKHHFFVFFSNSSMYLSKSDMNNLSCMMRYFSNSVSAWSFAMAAVTLPASCKVP